MRNILFLTIVLAPLSAFAAPDVVFNIDVGDDGQDVDAGDIGISSTGNGVDLPATNFIMPGTGAAVSITITDTDTSGSDVGAIDWRDRGNSTNSGDALVNLGEDLLKNNGGVINVTLEGLPEGTYDITSFHRDPGFSQSDMIDIFLSIDGAAFVDAGVDGSAGSNFGAGDLTTAEVMDGSAMFSFYTDGTGPVTIVFDGRASTDNETPLSGLTLAFTSPQAVPEPASIATWCMLLLGASIFGWRKLRRQ